MASAIGPLQQIIFRKSDFEDESLSLFNQQFSNIIHQLNNLLGVNGPVKFANHVDLGGNRLMNVGEPESPTDAVSQYFGNNNYGASAVQPQLEALGKSVMQSYRRLSDPNQRERFSSFLNQVLNTAPTANTSTVSAGSVSGGTIPITISSGFHQRVDGSVLAYSSRTDVLTLPGSGEAYYYYTISHGQNTLNVTGPYSADSQTNRVVASYDGTTIIAMVAITGFGFDANNSAGGGTAAQSGSVVQLLHRI